MYEIFKENRVRVPYNKIADLYSGKWVFLVNLGGTLLAPNEDGELEPCDPITAEVLVAADVPYGGAESGIYNEVKKNRGKYGSISEMDCRTGNILPSNYFLVKDGAAVD
jgi:hypothetical protein